MGKQGLCFFCFEVKERKEDEYGKIERNEREIISGFCSISKKETEK